jgi:hypothetical protein
LDETEGLFDCQQLFWSVNPSTEREKPLAGIFENSFPPLLYLEKGEKFSYIEYVKYTSNKRVTGWLGE